MVHVLHNLHHGGHIWRLAEFQRSWTNKQAVSPSSQERARLTCITQLLCWLWIWSSELCPTWCSCSVNYVGQHHRGVRLCWRRAVPRGAAEEVPEGLLRCRGQAGGRLGWAALLPARLQACQPALRLLQQLLVVVHTHQHLKLHILRAARMRTLRNYGG